LFYAERVWELIATRPGAGALKMESDLASLADLVVIIVESPGTFAELGAFSLVESLRRKLLPIVDLEYKGQDSFISTGPLRWIDQESDFKPTIYAPLPRILEAVNEIEERIGRIPKATTTRVADLAASPRHLLFFLCDLIGVIHPASTATVEYYLSRIVPSLSSASVDVRTLIGLGVAMGLLRTVTLRANGVEEVFVSPAAAHPTERPFHHKRYLDLPSQRADHVSVLLSIPTASAVMQQLKEAT
jgi:hypothetical protein